MTLIGVRTMTPTGIRILFCLERIDNLAAPPRSSAPRTIAPKLSHRADDRWNLDQQGRSSSLPLGETLFRARDFFL